MLTAPCLVLVCVAPQDAMPAPSAPVQVEFIHRGAEPWRGIVQASVPFGPGALRLAPGATACVAEVQLADQPPVPAPARPLLRWPDGSIALLQVQPRLELPPAGTQTASVVVPPGDGGLARTLQSPAHRPLLRLPLKLRSQCFDPWGRCYEAVLVPDPGAGPDGILSDTGAVCVRRYRSAHRALDGGALFDLRAYLVTFDGERRAELTLVLDNQEPLAGPLGAARFSGWRVSTGDPWLRFLPRFAAENLLPPAEPLPEGGFAQWLLRPDEHYLGDGTAKSLRLQLFQDGPEVADEERRMARAVVGAVAAFPQLDAVRRSGAFGAFGGPAPVEDGDELAAEALLLQWRLSVPFGPFRSGGDPANDFGPGHLRGGDAALHNVLRWRSPELLQAAELMVLQHTLRPTGGRRERQPADTAALRSGLGPLAQAAPHGFTPPSYEHASALLLYDYYWLTGDALARDELARLGRGILLLLRGAPFRTSRGEGNCLSSGVLCARATGDAALLAALHAHALRELLPRLFPEGSVAALPQPPHPRILDGATAFDASWQMAALVRGLCALHGATGDPALASAAVAVADAMADAAWLPEQGPKTFFAATDRSRYMLAASPADRAGYDRMTIGAFVLAARLAGDPEVAARLAARAQFLLDRELPVDSGRPVARRLAGDPWLQVVFDRKAAQ